MHFIETPADEGATPPVHRTRAGTPLVYEIDDAGQLTRIVNETSSATLQSFDCDAAGRMVAVRNGPPTAPIAEQFGYDALGRLEAYARATPGYAMGLEYDAIGNRRSRFGVGGTHLYFAGGLERHGTTRVRLVPGSASVGPVAEVHESAAYGLFRDGGPSVTAASSGAAIAARRSYDTFGTIDEASGSAPVERGFASLVQEGQSPLLYARARHYDPRFGRFLQRDPLGIDADQLYAYAANNPYRFHDPTGWDVETLNPLPVDAPTPNTPQGPSQEPVLIVVGGEFLSIDPNRDMESQIREEAARGTTAAAIAAGVVASSFVGGGVASPVLRNQAMMALAPVSQVASRLSTQAYVKASVAVGAALSRRGREAFVGAVDFTHGFAEGYEAGSQGNFRPKPPTESFPAFAGTYTGVGVGFIEQTIGIDEAVQYAIAVFQ